MIRFHCIECGMLIQANDSAVGRAAKCPGCGAVLEIPHSSAPIPPPPPKSEPVPPPIAPPPAIEPPPQMAAAASPESLSLDELLGGANAAAAASTGDRALGAIADTGLSDGSVRTPSKTGRKTNGRADAKPNTTKRGKTAAKSSAVPPQQIRNVSIAAIAAGTLGLALFAVPYAGAAIGVIGLVVGLYSVSLASARRNSPMALALAGAAVSVLAAGFGGYWTFRGATVAANAQKPTSDANADSTTAPHGPEANTASDLGQFAGAAVKAVVAGAVADARNPLSFATAAVRSAAADPSKTADRLASASGSPGAPGAARSAAPVTLRFQNSSDAADKATAVDAPRGAPSDGGDAASAPAAKAPIHWAAADQGEAQGNDDVRVTVSKVTTGILYIRFGDNDLLGGRETTQPLLHIWLKVQNNQTAGAIDYKGWITLPDADTELTDDKGAEIKRYDVEKLAPPGQHVAVVDGHPAAKIEVTQSNEDVIIFHLPPEGSQYLRLKVSGKPAGLPDDLYFQIPRSMIKVGETANPLLPLGNP